MTSDKVTLTDAMRFYRTYPTARTYRLACAIGHAAEFARGLRGPGDLAALPSGDPTAAELAEALEHARAWAESAQLPVLATIAGMRAHDLREAMAARDAHRETWI